MIKLQILSASNLPSADKNGLSDPYVIVYAPNFGEIKAPIGKTKTIKKTLNPKWEFSIYIPFVIFKSVHLSFWDSDAFSKDDELGCADIYPTINNFYRYDSQAITSNINLIPKYRTQQQSTFQYTIIPTMTNFEFKEKKNPKKFYVYLSYESYQPQINEKVHLFVYGVTRNGTIVDASSDLHTKGEIEASHYSQTGPVQVFYFNHQYLLDEKYFFIVTSKNYTGKVTLTFVSSPKKANKKNFISKFRIFNNRNSINISKQNDQDLTFSVFPVVLNFSEYKVQIESLSIPSNLATSSIQINNDDEDGLFLNEINRISMGVGQLLCPKNKLIHHRFVISSGKSYYLNEAFVKCGITSKPGKICFKIGWDTFTDLDSSVFLVSTNGSVSEAISPKTRRYDKSKAIEASEDSVAGTVIIGDDEVIKINLNKISNDVKCILLVISSQKLNFTDVDGCYFRIVDEETDKEVIFMPMGEKQPHTAVLCGVIVNISGSWKLFNCCHFFDSKTPIKAQKYLADFSMNGSIDRITSQ